MRSKKIHELIKDYVTSLEVYQNYKMYILVNKDLEISKGKLAGQVSHSVSSLLYSEFQRNTLGSPLYEAYFANGQKKIILSCSEKKLIELEELGYTSVRDLGLTELAPNTLTCVNLGLQDSQEDLGELNFIKKLKLLK